MQRQRGELVPIGEVFSDLDDGPLKTLRETSPQAVHHFTQADQVNQLVSASEADPDLGFMARLMALCSLPRTNPGDRKEYNASTARIHALIMTAIGQGFTSSPSVLTCRVCCWRGCRTEAVRTQSREIAGPGPPRSRGSCASSDVSEQR